MAVDMDTLCTSSLFNQHINALSGVLMLLDINQAFVAGSKALMDRLVYTWSTNTETDQHTHIMKNNHM